MGWLRSFRRRRFLTETERGQIAAGLAEASRYTRARIGLTIEERSAKDPLARARTLFREWSLPQAERPTAVLLYICAPRRSYAVVGGEETCRVVPPALWEMVERDLRHHFDDQRYCDGIFKAIAQLAVQLERHFPPEPAGAPEGEDPDAPAGTPPPGAAGGDGR